MIKKVTNQIKHSGLIQDDLSSGGELLFSPLNKPNEYEKST